MSTKKYNEDSRITSLAAKPGLKYAYCIIMSGKTTVVNLVCLTTPETVDAPDHTYSCWRFAVLVNLEDDNAVPDTRQLLHQ